MEITHFLFCFFFRFFFLFFFRCFFPIFFSAVFFSCFFSSVFFPVVPHRVIVHVFPRIYVAQCNVHLTLATYLVTAKETTPPDPMIYVYPLPGCRPSSVVVACVGSSMSAVLILHNRGKTSFY